MSVSQRLISLISPSYTSPSPRFLLNLRLRPLLSHHRLLSSSSSTALFRSSPLVGDSVLAPSMPRNKGNVRKHQWKVKSNPVGSSPALSIAASDTATESITNRLGELSVVDSGHSVPAVHVWNDAPQQHSLLPGQKVVWKPKSYGTVSGTAIDSQSGLGN